MRIDTDSVQLEVHILPEPRVDGALKIYQLQRQIETCTIFQLLPNVLYRRELIQIQSNSKGTFSQNHISWSIRWGHCNHMESSNYNAKLTHLDIYKKGFRAPTMCCKNIDFGVALSKASSLPGEERLALPTRIDTDSVQLEGHILAEPRVMVNQMGALQSYGIQQLQRQMNTSGYLEKGFRAPAMYCKKLDFNVALFKDSSLPGEERLALMEIDTDSVQLEGCILPEPCVMVNQRGALKLYGMQQLQRQMDTYGYLERVSELLPCRCRWWPDTV